MMARVCDACGKAIEQDSFVELGARVLDPVENENQDAKRQAWGDYCDGCIASGAALADLLQQIDWKLEPKTAPKEPT